MIHAELIRLRPDIIASGSPHDCADAAYALNEAWKYLDDSRKEVQALQELSEKLTCVKVVSLDVGESIKTAHVTAVPDCKILPSLPSKSKDFNNYVKLMSALGVPQEIIQGETDESDVVKPHFPAIQRLCTELARAGKPLPAGINPDKTYPQYRLTLRPRKGVDE